MSVTVRTNNVPRDLIYAYELTASEREQFDYLDWQAIDDGRDGATFFRYKGEVYDVGQFMRFDNPTSLWEGHCADSYFSATVIRFVEDGERVIVGRMYS